MTAPIIPADQWPEWADRHCWDETGRGEFYGVFRALDWWVSTSANSGIPMPSGWDWRVPVMRPGMGNPVSAPAIDLEQFRAALIALSDYAYERHGSMDHQHCREADRLLALIDVQKAGVMSAAEFAKMGPAFPLAAQPARGEPAPCSPDQLDLCDICRVREETRTDAEGIPFCDQCWDEWQAGEQPTKGEGVAGG